jgi:outer membrane lipoprotein
MKHLLIPAIIMLITSGCAHVVSKEMLEIADRKAIPSRLFSAPDAYIGKTVVLGGIIASSSNTPEGAYIEVVEQPLDYRGRPKSSDLTRGRFLILHDGYLETALYSQGKHVTVAGEVLGKKTRPLDRIHYSYLLLKSRELYLVEPGRWFSVQFGIGISTRFD